MRRPCLGCGHLIASGSRCDRCASAHDAARGTTAARGYGSEHQRQRARWRPLVESGEVTCSRCGQPILPGQAWDLGHDDSDRSRWTGPEHAACNRATNRR